MHKLDKWKTKLGNALGQSLASVNSSGSYQCLGTAASPYVDPETGEHIVLGKPYQTDFPQVVQSVGAIGDGALLPVDRSNDVMVAAGDGVSLGRSGVREEGVYVKPDGTRVMVLDATGGSPGGSLITGPPIGGFSADLGSGSYDNPRTPSGVMVVRAPDIEDMPSWQVNNVGSELKLPGNTLLDDFGRGLSGERRSVLEGPASFGENLGLAVNGLVTGPVRAAYGFASEIGSEYKDAYNLLTRDGASYTPSSALANSLQRNGAGSTLAGMGESMLSSPTKPIFDLLEGNYRAFGEGLPGIAAMGMVRGVGSGLQVANTRVLRQTGSGGFLDAADDLYASVRASTSDIFSIAANTEIKPANIQKVKDHVFYNENLLDKYVDYEIPPVKARFDSDINQAQAWGRLESGAHTAEDMTWLKHEAAERWYELRNNSGYTAAHDAAEKKWLGNPWGKN